MSPSIVPGMRLTSDLTLVRELGRGSMGEVWVGATAEREVAVKFLGAHLKEDESSVQRFEREWKVASSIACKHIVQMIATGTTDAGQRYIVMELLQGETLESVLEGIVGGMSPSATITLLRQVAVALDTAHALGIVHRDIKPENVFLCKAEDGLVVKIVDFGLAKPFAGELNCTATGVLVGTPYYMSPEQLLEGGQNLDHRADLWALGALAYRMLLGCQPFDSDNLTDLLLQVTSARYKSVAEAGGPAELAPFFAKAFQLDRTRRHRSAGEMIRELCTSLGVPWDGDDGSVSTVVMGDTLPEPEPTAPALDRTMILDDERPRAGSREAIRREEIGRAPTQPFPAFNSSAPPPALASMPPFGSSMPPPTVQPSTPPPAVPAVTHASIATHAPPPPRSRAPLLIAVVVFILCAAGLLVGWLALRNAEPERAPVRQTPAPEPSAAPPATSASARASAPPPRRNPAPAASASAPPIDPMLAKAKAAYLTVRCTPECFIQMDETKKLTERKKTKVRAGKHTLTVFRAVNGKQITKKQSIDLTPGEDRVVEIQLGE